MNDIKLLRIALVIGVAGIITLFFLSKTMQAEATAIGQITEEEIGRKVMIEGVVESVAEKKSVTMLEIKEPDTEESISVVIFDKKQYVPKKEETISVTGTVKDYNGNLEIVAERIIPIES